MSDPTPIKAPRLARIPAHPRRALHIETVGRQHHHADACEGGARSTSDSAHCSKQPPTPDTSASSGSRTLPAKKSKGHLIRTWKRTRKAIPAHVRGGA